MLIRFVGAIFLAAALGAFAGELRKVTLGVKGMDCAACPVTVKVVLMKQPGVTDVKVDAEHHTASVTFDPVQVSAETLAEAVTQTGYPATPRS